MILVVKNGTRRYTEAGAGTEARMALAPPACDDLS
jgi:hypothetical protein